jgi:hypothetical protein
MRKIGLELSGSFFLWLSGVNTGFRADFVGNDYENPRKAS